MASGWGSLAEELVRRIAACLPVDARLAAAATCSGWRDALRCGGAWTDLDLSPASGVAAPVNEALLRAASRRARGLLRSLDASRTPRAALPVQALRAVLWANSGSLATVRLEGAAWLSVADVEALLRAGGEQLRALHADVVVWLPAPQVAHIVLAHVATGRLVLHGVLLRGREHMGAACVDNAAALLRALVGQEDARVVLEDMHLGQPGNATPAQLATLLDALASLSGVREFSATNCGLCSDALRAVAGAAMGRLRALSVCDEAALLDDAGGLDALSALLAANARALQQLTLRAVCAHGASAGALVCAVCGGAALPALKELRLAGNGRHPDHHDDDDDDNDEDEDEDEDEDDEDEDAYDDASSYDDDTSSDEEAAAAAGDDAAPAAPAAPPPAAADEAGCGEACAALLARSPALALLTLPWLLASSLSGMLPALQRCTALTRLDLQVRNVSDDWLCAHLFPALQRRRPLILQLEAHDAFQMYRSGAAGLDRRLRDAAEAAGLSDCAHHGLPYRRDAPPAWDDWERGAMLRGALGAEGGQPQPGAFRRRAAARLRRGGGDDDGQGSGGSDRGYSSSEGSLDYAAYSKAMRAWQEREECALREPRSRSRPWQHGRRDFGALPARVIPHIWARLALRDRIAVLGVCRAWRAGFAPPDGFRSLRPPADADARLLRQLTPVFDGLQLFDAGGCKEGHLLGKEEIECFLWNAACRRTLDAELPVMDPPCTVEEVNALLRLSKHASVVADVTASSAAPLLACMRAGLAARSLTLSGDAGDVDGGAWDAESVLACVVALCARAAPYAHPWRTHAHARAPPAPPRLCISGVRVKWAPRRPGYDAAPVEDAQRFAALERVLEPLGDARLGALQAYSCRLTRRFVPPICGLLRCGLRSLSLCAQPRLLKRSRRHDQGSMTLLAAAIRAAPALRELMLRELDVPTQADVATLIAACTAHPTLSELRIDVTSKDGGHAHDAAAAARVGAALGALVAANAPALTTLWLYGECSAAQVVPLAAALRRGGHSISDCADVEELHGSLLADALAGSGAARDAEEAAQ
jgi:hypothetical protein